MCSICKEGNSIQECVVIEIWSSTGRFLSNKLLQPLSPVRYVKI